MGTTILCYTGSTVPPHGFITSITETSASRSVVYDLPTANYDIVQSLGSKNRKFVIEGVCTNGNCTSVLRTALDHTGSLSHTDDTGVTWLSSTQIFFSDIEFKTVPKNPLIQKFKISAIEVK